jgi:hypothetical protein
MMNHVMTHVVSPFEDLMPDVRKKGIQRPPSKDHDLVDRVVMEELGRSTTGAKGVSPDVSVMESKGFLVATIMAGVPE